jgi:ABC-type transport system involved in cytochrome c biogenesis ATPase subunit
MKVKGVRQHRSIDTFEPVELPALTILIGLNGSGKSHFLEGIENDSIVTDIFASLEGPFSQFMSVPKPNGAILRLENGASAPVMLDQRAPSNLTHPLSPGMQPQHMQPRNSVLARFEHGRATLLKPALANLRNVIGSGWANLELGDIEVWTIEPEKLANITGAWESLEEIKKAFVEAESSLTEVLSPQSELNHVVSLINQVAIQLEISALSVTAAHVDDLNSWGGFAAFDPNVAQLFGSYRDAHLRNDLQRVRDNRNGTKTALTDEEFVNRYGLPPWQHVSEILKAFGLNYRVAEPSDEPTEQVSFVLLRLDTSVPVSFGGLSSGERVLLRFALSLLNYDPLRMGVTLPKLLLLDEMDASLHPEMVHRWLTAIADGLVEQKGVSCILTTHSPTTVALAPEDSLFELVAGSPAPRKITKQQALNRLTLGLPTLSIDYSGRRQVFVESDTDANAYEAISNIMKGRLSLPRTLTFISTGIRTKNTETNTGCATVKKLVADLSHNGNMSVFGIIDWDGKNKGNGRLKVLAEGTHYALENLLLDPLLIGALLLRDRKSLSGIHYTFSSLDFLGVEELQTLADAVQDSVAFQNEQQERVSNEYYGGISLKVRPEYLTMHGHSLEEVVVKAHPALNKYHKGGRGHLTKAIIDAVLIDYPKFCPLPIAHLFETIANETN